MFASQPAVSSRPSVGELHDKVNTNVCTLISTKRQRDITRAGPGPTFSGPSASQSEFLFFNANTAFEFSANMQ